MRTASVTGFDDWCMQSVSWNRLSQWKIGLSQKKKRREGSELLGFELCPSSGILQTRKQSVSENWICFRHQVRGETPTQLLGPLQRANLSHWRLDLSKGPNWIDVFPPHLRTETDPVFETLCFLVSRIPDDGQSSKPSNSECYTPSSEPFRICCRGGCSRIGEVVKRMLKAAKVKASNGRMEPIWECY
jgi:hypothetical protein